MRVKKRQSVHNTMQYKLIMNTTDWSVMNIIKRVDSFVAGTAILEISYTQ